jgi:hypothetical protein
VTSVKEHFYVKNLFNLFKGDYIVPLNKFNNKYTILS